MTEIITELGGGYSILPRVVRKAKNLSNSAKLCYTAIVDYSFNNLYCFPTQDTIADELGVTEKRASAILRELREYGLIKVLQQFRDSNIYVLIPLKAVNNLWEELYYPVDRDSQYIDRDEFNTMVLEFKEFYSSIAAVPVTKKKTVTYADKVARVADIFAGGRFDELTASDLCVVFANKYKEVFNEEYVINWRTDTSAITLRLIKQSITGKEAVSVIERLVTAYMSNFYSSDYKRPRIPHIKIDWLFKKLLTIMVNENQADEQQQRVENMEVVGEW